MRWENVCVMDRHFYKKSNFWQHPCRQMIQSENFCTMELSEVPNFYSLGIVFMVVKALHTTFPSVSLMDKMLTLNWSHSLMSLLYLNPLKYSIQLTNWILWNGKFYYRDVIKMTITRAKGEGNGHFYHIEVIDLQFHTIPFVSCFISLIENTKKWTFIENLQANLG